MIPRKIMELGDDTRGYFSRYELTQHVVVAERGNIPDERPEDVPAILYTLLEIPGICYIEVHVYHFVVGKNPLYTWKEIEPAVFALLDCFNAGEGLITAPDDCEPLQLGQGWMLVFQRRKNDPQMVRAVLQDPNGRTIWKGEPLDRRTISRELQIEQVRQMFQGAALPPGVQI